MRNRGSAHRADRWWQHAAIYELYVRSFQDGNGDGVGDLPGILKRADYLTSLGVDAVWLTPFYTSPMVDAGYDVADHCGVDPLFGSLRDFDEVVAALAGRGVRTIVDLVPNHTSDQHPWFVESRSSRSGRRRDWYVWRRPARGGGPPNNWLSQPSGSAWSFDERSGEYYLHSFLPSQPDLNWRNPEVRKAFQAIMRFWLDRGVAGFRVDVADRLLKDPAFRDDPPNLQYRNGDPEFMRLLPVNSSDQADVQEIVAEFRSVLAEYENDPVLIGEIYQPVERLTRFYGEGLEGFHLPFNFNLMWLDWCADGVFDLIQRYEAALPDCAWPTWVLGNHDQHRVASRLGAVQARVAMMLLLTLRGTPTLYQGDELGLEDGNITADRRRDPFARLDPTRGRDPFRTPMPWDGTKFGSFSSVEPWLPLSLTDPRLSISAQLADDLSMLALTKRCLALRRREPALRIGMWDGVSSDDGVLIYRRSFEQSKLLIALNFTSQRKTVRCPANNAARLISTHGPCVSATIDRNLELLPDEGLILRILD